MGAVQIFVISPDTKSLRKFLAIFINWTTDFETELELMKNMKQNTIKAAKEKVGTCLGHFLTAFQANLG